MPRTRLGIALAFTLLLSAALPAQARWWVYFTSCEHKTGKPPRLEIRTGNGRVRRIPASADATLIKYLGNGAYGTMDKLSVGSGEQNRALIGFTLPRSIKARSLERADLLLDMRLSKQPPRTAVPLAVHRVTADWSERTVSWNNQPTFHPEPILSIEVVPKAEVLRWDVTDLVKGWLTDRKTAHGILVKQGGVETGAAERLLADLPWENDPAAALAKAKQLKRPVVVLVRGAHDANAENLPELTLLAIAFTEPVVRDLVRRRFVPLRIAVNPRDYTFGRRRGPNPLALLDADSTRLKAPALIVVRANGRAVARLETIGTFDAPLIDRFLRHALLSAATPSAQHLDPAEQLADGNLDAADRAAAGRPAAERAYWRACVAARRGDHALAVRLAHDAARSASALAADARVAGGVSLMRQGDFTRAARLLEEALTHDPPPTRAAEALYRLGCLAMRRADAAAAERFFSRVQSEHPKSSWALKVSARRSWPERIDAAENLRALAVDPRKLTSTEQPTAKQALLVPRAIIYLLEQQRTDGAWPSEQDQYRAAITAFAANALDAWAPQLKDRALGTRCRGAVKRALDWLGKWMAEKPAADASTFGATYLLDFLLAHHGRTQQESLKPFVQRAVDHLLGGQCPNGAWAYSRRFGVNWKGGFGGWPKTDKGRTHSMNTGPALLFLALADRAGLRVDEKALARATRVMKQMRTNPGVYTYTFPEPINFQKPDQSIARGPGCEHALFARGAVKARHLDQAIETFLAHRAALRLPVKLNKSWGNPHAFSSYFYFFAYYHAALAIRERGGNKATERLKALQADLLRVPELDATWVDFHQTGKPYGTAAALLILAMTR